MSNTLLKVLYDIVIKYNNRFTFKFPPNSINQNCYCLYDEDNKIILHTLDVFVGVRNLDDIYKELDNIIKEYLRNDKIKSLGI